MRIFKACGSCSIIAAKLSLTPFGLPGRLIIKDFPRIPATGFVRAPNLVSRCLFMFCGCGHDFNLATLARPCTISLRMMLPCRRLFFPCEDNIGLQHLVRLPTRKSRMSTGDPGMMPCIQGIFLTGLARNASRSGLRACSQNGVRHQHGS